MITAALSFCILVFVLVGGEGKNVVGSTPVGPGTKPVI